MPARPVKRSATTSVPAADHSMLAECITGCAQQQTQTQQSCDSVRSPEPVQFSVLCLTRGLSRACLSRHRNRPS
jgi:hypothetical protein